MHAISVARIAEETIYAGMTTNLSVYTDEMKNLTISTERKGFAWDSDLPGSVVVRVRVGKM